MRRPMPSPFLPGDLDAPSGGLSNRLPLRVGEAVAHSLREVYRPVRRALRVAVTGGIGSGKSTFSRALGELPGCVIADADVLSREVVEVGTEGLGLVRERFGTRVIRPDGSLDRPALGAIVFNDVDARRDLEAIIHPLVHERVEEILAEAGVGQIAVYDVPLLVEAGAHKASDFDAVVVVTAPLEVRLRRLEGRGMDEAEARRRIAAQASDADRAARAHILVENGGSAEELGALARLIESTWWQDEGQQ